MSLFPPRGRTRRDGRPAAWAIQEADANGSPVTWGEHVADEEYADAGDRRGRDPLAPGPLLLVHSGSEAPRSLLTQSRRAILSPVRS
jgi:hypothetical protein